MKVFDGDSGVVLGDGLYGGGSWWQWVMVVDAYRDGRGCWRPPEVVGGRLLRNASNF